MMILVLGNYFNTFNNNSPIYSFESKITKDNLLSYLFKPTIRIIMM